jgi:hypothetical protein
LFNPVLCWTYHLWSNIASTNRWLRVQLHLFLYYFHPKSNSSFLDNSPYFWPCYPTWVGCLIPCINSQIDLLLINLVIHYFNLIQLLILWTILVIQPVRENTQHLFYTAPICTATVWFSTWIHLKIDNVDKDENDVEQSCRLSDAIMFLDEMMECKWALYPTIAQKQLAPVDP